MKKILALLLASLMILSASACNSSLDDLEDFGDDNIGGEENEENDGSLNSGDSENNGSSNRISMDSISYATGYGNGLMKVSVKSGKSTTYFFVNKKGERVLEFPHEEGKSFSHSDLTFVGKYHPITQRDTTNDRVGVTVLLDTAGKIIHPADVGVTEFLVLEKDIALEMMKDGYILAKLEEGSYSSETVTSLLILDNEFKKISDISDVIELYELYQYKYLAGFIYKEDKAIDLKTGKVYTDLADMYSQLTFKHASDWWECGNGGYYDIRDPEKKLIISMDKFPNTRDSYYDFNFADGLCAIMFHSGHNYYFSIIDENGEMLFEPVTLLGTSGTPRIYSCNGIYAVFTGTHIYTFDKNGKIAETAHGVNFSYFSVKFDEDVIVVDYYSGNSSIRIYTTNLNPLF